MTAKNLGDILIEQGIIDRDALNRALQIQNRRLGEILIEEKLADPVAIANALKFQARSSIKARTSRLSIETRVFEEMLSRLEALEDQLSGPALADQVLLSFKDFRQDIEALLVEPIEQLFQKVRWVGLQTANDLGKQVSLKLDGHGLVIDKSLAEDLSDMVLHLVRNAVDHGIESPEDRLAAGKSHAGAIQIEVALLSGRLQLTISDDGQGMDEDRVYAKGVALGLLTAPRDQVSSEQLHRLLFTPGFSTADKVTTVSGRGVGLDVVEANLIRLGGEIRVQPERGKGTTFIIRVPLRCIQLSILPLRVGAEWFGVNASEVAEVSGAGVGEKVFSGHSLFLNDVSLPPSEKSACLRTQSGRHWSFDEISRPEIMLVREASAFAHGGHGVIGNARMQNGRNILIVDLGLLETLAKPC